MNQGGEEEGEEEKEEVVEEVFGRNGGREEEKEMGEEVVAEVLGRKGGREEEEEEQVGEEQVGEEQEEEEEAITVTIQGEFVALSFVCMYAVQGAEKVLYSRTKLKLHLIYSDETWSKYKFC